VIVVDLSRAGAGTLWEVEELFRRGYGYKSLFMVRDDDGAELKLVCLIRWTLADRGRLVYRYGDSNPGPVAENHVS
jgi:hypothetical protein